MYIGNNNYRFDTRRTREVIDVDCKTTFFLIMNNDSSALLSMPIFSLFIHSLFLFLLLMWIRGPVSTHPFKGWEMGPHFPPLVFMGNLFFFLAQNFTTMIVQLSAIKKSKKVNGARLKFSAGIRV